MQLIILRLAFGVAALIGGSARSESSHDSPRVMPYAFSYGVNFPPTGDAKEHREVTSSTGLTQGEYRWLQPNGLFRVVRYYIDGPSGFIAEVTEEEGPEVINYASSNSNGLGNVLNFDDSYKGGIPIDSVAGKSNLGFQTPDLHLGSHGFQTSQGLRGSNSKHLQGSHNVQGHHESKSFLGSQGYQDPYIPLKYPGQRGAGISLGTPVVHASPGLEPQLHHEVKGIQGIHGSQEGKGQTGYQDSSGIFSSQSHKDLGNLPGSQLWTFGSKSPEPVGKFSQGLSFKGLLHPQVTKEFPSHAKSHIHYEGIQEEYSPPHQIKQGNLDLSKQNAVFIKTNPFQKKKGYDYTPPKTKTTLTGHDVYSSKDVPLSDPTVTFPGSKITGQTSYDYTRPESPLTVLDSRGLTKQSAGLHNIGPNQRPIGFDYAAPKPKTTTGMYETKPIYKNKELSTVSKVGLSQPNNLKSNIRISSVSFLELTPEGILKQSKGGFSNFNNLNSPKTVGIKIGNSGLSRASSFGANLLTQSLIQSLSSVQNRDNAKTYNSHHQGDQVPLVPKVTYVKKIENQPEIHRQTLVSRPHLPPTPKHTKQGYQKEVSHHNLSIGKLTLDHSTLKKGFPTQKHSTTKIKDEQNKKDTHLFGKGGLNIDFVPSNSYLPPPPGGNAGILKIEGESDLSQGYELPNL